MMTIARLIAAILLIVGIASPALADDISAAGRGVVRVVTIASAQGEVVGFGHGSGFAITPNRIVTNAHVVELAARFPDNVLIGVVPSEGTKSYRGRLIAYDPRRDLALIEFSGAPLPALTLFPGPVADGEAVVALGYPGNVDLATAQSSADYIKPLSPVRSQGGFAGLRNLTGIEVLLHTAGIARGNSGGPLLDECGRVIGVNSAVTRAEEGDSSFGFAIADTELAAFLREAKQPFATIGVPCTSIAERLQQDKAAEEQEQSAAAAAAQTAKEAALARQQLDLENARAERQRSREDVIGLAGFALVLGAMGVGGGALLAITGRRRGAAFATIGGVLMMAGAVALFVFRPSGPVVAPALSAPANLADSAAASTSPAKLACRIIPERSRINLSLPNDVTLDWGRDGCANGGTQYAENGQKWERILVPDREQTVSVLEYNAATSTYANRRYLLSAAQMAAARRLRGTVSTKACLASEPDRQKLAAQQAAIKDALPPQPDEWLIYKCGSESALPPAENGAATGQAKKTAP
ncbi:MAG: serine protease [Sphingomonas sp.]|jgi:S1-C subfamily serine protease